MTLAERVQQVAECAVHAERETGYPAEILGGQAALESAWHASMPKNAPFGKKATDLTKDCELCITTEWFTPDQAKRFVEMGRGREILGTLETKGERTRYKVKDWFETFPNIRDAYIAHARWLQESPRYRPVWDSCATVRAGGVDRRATREEKIRNIALGLAVAGYATTPPKEYAKSLLRVALGKRLRDALTLERAKRGDHLA